MYWADPSPDKEFSMEMPVSLSAIITLLSFALVAALIVGVI
ncbi:MAG TPA: hypothetical protein VIG26_02860 [Methyloceanibacter sp.]